MVLNLENQINEVLAHRGLVLKYKETMPSSAEDMYEFNAWFEDNQLNRYPFHTFFIRNTENKPDFNYKRKALKMLLNLIIEAYFDNVNPITKKDGDK